MRGLLCCQHRKNGLAREAQKREQKPAPRPTICPKGLEHTTTNGLEDVKLGEDCLTEQALKSGWVDHAPQRLGGGTGWQKRWTKLFPDYLAW